MSDAHVARHSRQVLIIGGGIAGLAAALRVRALDQDCRITIVDAAQRLGGKIAGEIVDGCVVDGGADVCIGGRLRTTHMFSALHLASRVVTVNPNNLPTFERRDKALRQLQTGFTGELLTFRTGMREMVDVAYAALADVSITTDASIASLRTDADGWYAETSTGESCTANAVVVATPAGPAATLLASVAPVESAHLRTVQYPATTTVTMAWRTGDVPHTLHGTGYLVPDTTSIVSACTWASSKNPTHAPRGTTLLRGYVRGFGVDAASLVRAELAAVLGITAAPIFTRTYEWQSGIPTYTPEHVANVQALAERIAAVPGLFIAGAAFHGVGIPDCIHSGERAAAAVVAYLAARPSEEAA